MGLQRDYEALRWWTVLPLLVVLTMTNGLVYKGFELAWSALVSGADLSFLYYVVPGARQTYEAYAACGHPDLGSFHAGLLIFNVFVVVAMDVAVVQATGRIVPLCKTQRIARGQAMNRCLRSAFLAFGILGALFIYDIDVIGCDGVGARDLGEMFVPALMASILALVGTPAMRNAY